MGLLDFVDPTRDWPVVNGPAPNIDTALMQFAQLRFGAPLDSARFLGKPDEFHWKGLPGKSCELLYASKGLRLRFDDRKLTEVSFLIAAREVVHPAFKPAAPVAPDGTRLSIATDRDAIESVFGKSDPLGSDDVCLQVFHGLGVASDFYLDSSGHLTEWSLYPD